MRGYKKKEGKKKKYIHDGTTQLRELNDTGNDYGYDRNRTGIRIWKGTGATDQDQG